MIQINLMQVFPASLDRLWAVFGRDDYPRQKYAALGATAVRTHVFNVTAKTIDVELERDVPLDTGRLPAWARFLVRGKQTLRHRSEWRRTGPTHATAELEVFALDLPVRARGTATITETSKGTSRMAMTWQVRSDAPVIKRSVERLFADLIRAALEDDHAFTLQYLETHRAGLGRVSVD